MQKPKQPAKPVIWTIHHFGAKLKWLGHVDAVDEASAIAAAAVEFGKDPKRLTATKGVHYQ